MKKVLKEELEKQRRLMNLDEQSAEKSFTDAVVDYLVGGFKSIFSPEEEPKKSAPKPKVAFSEVFKNIIEKIEGGYYHPDMVYGGRGFPKGSKAMGDSGETMFGVDRKHGGEINNTAEANQFWNIIDKAGASKKWVWDYRGGNLESRLVILAITVMQDAYDRFANRYLSTEAKKIVDSDQGLLTHFGYATWNGPGWFRKFADSINTEVKSGNKDPKKLLRKGLSDRKVASNKLISNSAEKIEQILGTNLV
jgi:hypothetical protein